MTTQETTQPEGSSSKSSWATMASNAAKSSPETNNNDTSAAGPSTPSQSSSTSPEPKIDSLILDAGPLLAQLPLRGMAKKFYISPSVVAELKDKKAREYLEFLRIGGTDIQVREASPECLAAVIAFAKQTGDYSVLSRPDLSVLALAYAVEVERHGTWRIRSELGGKTGQQMHEAQKVAQGKKSDSNQNDSNSSKKDSQQQVEGSNATASSSRQTTDAADSARAPAAAGDAEEQERAEEVADADVEEDEDAAGDEVDPDEVAAAIAKMDLQRQRERKNDQTEEDQGESADEEESGWTTVPSSSSRKQQQQDQDFGGSDGEGEWITSDNITTQKHKDLGLVTDEALTAMRGGAQGESTSKAGKSGKGKSKKGKGRMTVATMTADYAVQNVLLQMGMALISTEGYRIEKVRSWVLRCHACFKICKDSERKFCPECGNPSLIRTSVTSQAPGSSAATTTTNGLQVHLKKNFQYKTRGNIYSLPLPKPGSSSSGKDPKKSNLILREDQVEWQRGLFKDQVRKNKEQKALDRALEKGKDTISARYEDPDWLPSMLLGNDNEKQAYMGLPDIGFGRRNPNQAKHGRRRK
ncbi:unnamed protein product [Sympodiomycopsis kandeliae]